ncbi:MAG: FtsX-like permease family protein [Oscillospiraceae bacterium]|nr:FtsX-like permease family protein [Oscillospiraceae bacterium]
MLEAAENGAFAALGVKAAALETVKNTPGATEEQIQAAQAAFDQAQQDYIMAKTAHETAKALIAAEPQISAAEKTLTSARAEYNAGFKKYEDGFWELYNGRRSYDAGMEEYLEGLQKYTDGYEKYAEGEVEYYDGYTEFSVNKEKLDLGWDQYEEGRKALDEAKEKYEQGLIDYEDGLEEYNTKLADAEKELADAREKIEDAGNAQWYVFTRDDNQGYSEYNDNAERIDRIAAIFPMFFLLVAGLVCLTTMSRMVEEQRTQIGTLKALGYSRGDIMRHYMTYAVTAALVGGVIGAIGGCYLFPSVIVYAYSMLYKITDIHYMFTASNLILSIGSMTLAIALTVYFSCDKALKETPASLMRPKAPKAGKRIFLEKISFIWGKMNFFAKVSARNLIRYKKRMLMTIVGIAGCTALSLTGFGLKNSIMDVADLQYTDIYQYSGYLAYKDDIKLSELNSIYKTLTDYEPETEYTRALIKQYDLEHSGNSMQGYITAVEDPELFETFVDMRERRSGEEIKFSEQDGAVITEKLAKMLGAKIGDEITVKVSEGVNRRLKITAITEHYAGHYIYVSESDYKAVFGSLPKYNMIYFQNGISMDDDEQEKFTEHVLENKNVAAVMMNAASLNSIHDTMKIMDLVVLVLIVSAAALAFVVLYNLTNVNITERIREIATLKVLGFYDVEVSSYVFRESIVLSLLGALVGLGLGVALCMFVINTAEIDEIMFGRKIHAISYLWAFLVTAAFSLIVNLIMTRVLKKISMVESLKSVE